MSPSPPSSQNAPDPRSGEFLNGTWRCNCQPRQVATIKTVNTNNKNYGKRFYTCPRKREEQNRCDMFILLDDARQRELDSILSNGRSEKRQMTLLEAMTPRSKEKRDAGDTTPPTENDDANAAVDGGSTPKPAAAALPSTAPPMWAAAGSSASAFSSTLKSSTQDIPERSAEFYDTTSDEEEDETTHTTNNNNNKESVQPSALPINTPNTSTNGAANKGKRRFQEDEDDFLDDLSSGGEEELVAVTERSCKSARHHNAYTTPSLARAIDLENGLPTPSLTKGKSVKKVLFKDVVETDESSGSDTRPSKRRQLGNGTAAGGSAPAGAATTLPVPDSVRLFGTDKTIGSPPSPTATMASQTHSQAPPSSLPSTLPPPTPSQNANHHPSSSSASDLTKEVMDLLIDTDISFSARTQVRKVLDKHAKLAKGYERGRDAARKAVKESEERVARLQNEIKALEAAKKDLEVSRMETRSEMMALWRKF
ncbi:hypothetical protein F4777DRAFT_284752 [Nemania sp. FL0916]|nr:hypothetical protein F4777DRAFT_284752 [Nemania sp. FL0916]